MKSLCAPILIACFAAPALALQGSDSCSTPTAIAGQGSFAYDNTAATTGANIAMSNTLSQAVRMVRISRCKTLIGIWKSK